jgi:hypothetical protein
MLPARLTDLLFCPGAAAGVVEAIDDPSLGRGRGWDLLGWRHDPEPWGVRFSYRGSHSRGNGARALLLG